MERVLAAEENSGGGHEPAPGAEPDGRGSPPEREIDSGALFGAARTLIIRHGRERYTLRVTRAGKLILTK